LDQNPGLSRQCIVETPVTLVIPFSEGLKPARRVKNTLWRHWSAPNLLLTVWMIITHGHSLLETLRTKPHCIDFDGVLL